MTRPMPHRPRSLFALTLAGVVASLTFVASGPAAGAAPGAAEVLCDGRVATIVGTEGDDVLGSTADAEDVIASLAGDDRIIAYGSDDLICGGSGNDSIFVERDGRIFGGAGQDAIGGPRGYNELFGGSGDDTLAGGFYEDLLVGGPGDDELVPGEDSADEFVRGGPGRDRVFYATDVSMIVRLNRQAAHGHGDDRLAGIEDVRTGDGDDLVVCDSGPNTLVSGGGRDVLRGGGGSDALDGEGGEDEGAGGPGLDTCTSIELATSCRRLTS